jgi:hypothetical protein
MDDDETDDRVEEPTAWTWKGYALTFAAFVTVAVIIHVFEIGKPKPPLTNYPVIRFLLPGYDDKRCNILRIQYDQRGFYC